MRIARGRAVSAVVLAVVVALLEPTGQGAARAATGDRICEQYGTSEMSRGRYYAQNNRWSSAAEQCITLTERGFVLSTSRADNPTNGAPASYPSMVYGCHYGKCTTGFSPVAARSRAFTRLRTKVTMSYPSSGEWNAAYDLWFDPTPRRDGQNTGAEIMVWLNHAGRPQPIGSKVGTATIAGTAFDVWSGDVGWNVVSYVAQTPVRRLGFAPAAFLADAVRRGAARRSWYLTSIQAGFEPWIGGAGLAISDFSVTRRRHARARSSR